MMQRFILIILAAILSSCTIGRPPSPPALTAFEANQDKVICDSIFPRGKWQFVHSLEFSRSDGRGTTVIGITNLGEHALHTAILTVEGLTLFEADFHGDDSFQVHRAVPPFDNPNFAQGMMKDIKTIFRPPQGTLRIGKTTMPQTVCRYTNNDGRITDVLFEIDEYRGDCWQIRRYSAEQGMELEVVGTSCRNTMSSLIPAYIELQSYGVAGYTLKMKLLSVDRL